MNNRQLRVIASCFLLFALSVPGFAQARKQQFYAGTLDGTTGLFKTWDAENLQRGETNFTFGYDQFNRDPGQLVIGRAVVGAAVGVVDRFEIFGNIDAHRRITADNIQSHTNNDGFHFARTPTGALYFTQDAPFIGAQSGSGRGDARIGARLNLFSERRGNPLSLAVAGVAAVPGGRSSEYLHRGLSKGTTDVGVFLLVSKTVADVVRFHGNVGFNSPFHPHDSRGTWIQDEVVWRGGAEFPVHSSFRIIAEMTGTVLVDTREPELDNRLNDYRPMEVIAGVRYYPTRWFSLGGAYQASIHSFSDEPAIQSERGGYHGFIVQGALGTRRSLEPLTVSLSVANNQILQDDTTAIRANVHNPQGGRLTYSWSSSPADGNIRGSGDQVEFSSPAAGTYNVTVTVSSGRETASASAPITVNRRPVAPTVSIEPTTFSLLPGESVNLRCVATDPNNSPLTYAWTVNGQNLGASGPQITFGSEGRNPGTYNVTCTVSNGDLSASATSNGTINARPNQQPTISCQAAPVSVASGASVQLSVTASDPDGDALTFSWSSPVGAVGGNSNTTTFNAAGVRAGSYTVTATADDGRGGRASCNITVNVSERRVIARDDCGYFTSNGTRVDNCAKAILDDIALQMRNDASLRATVFGFTDNSRVETTRKGLGEARARAMAAYLQEVGIDASRIQTVDAGVGEFGNNATAAGRTLNRRAEIELAPR